MAISHVQPLLLLLASFFFLPALRAVDFEYCNKIGYDFGNVTRVEISPTPVIEPDDDEDLNISVFGYAIKSIDEGSIEVYAKSENRTDLVKRFFLCVVGEACAIEAGTDFVLPLTDVPQGVMEGEYKYVVALLDENVRESEEPIVRMCVDFNVPTSAPTLVSA